MDVLLTEQRPGAATSVVAALRAGGHRVWTCAPPDGAVAACAGLATGRCPMDTAAVVVDVRTSPAPPTTAGEPAVFCAAALDRPLITVGPAGTRAAVDWAVAGCTQAELPATLSDVADATRLQEQSGPSIPRLVRLALRRIGVLAPADVRVVAAGDHPEVVISLRSPLPPELARRLGLAVRLALRGHAWGGAAEVSVVSGTPPS